LFVFCSNTGFAIANYLSDVSILQKCVAPLDLLAGAGSSKAIIVFIEYQ